MALRFAGFGLMLGGAVRSSFSFRRRQFLAGAAGMAAGAFGVQRSAASTAVPGRAASGVDPVLTAANPSFQPLFPFANLAHAQAWQQAYASGKHAPWHLSPELTAVAFSQQYLGFSEINKVAGHSVSQGDARVAVGLTLPDGRVSSAAIVRLVRYGSGNNAPWEVVGTDDTSLTLDTPAYGATVASPVKIAAAVEGVDEYLQAEAHALGADQPLGTFCCQPAGSRANPWSLTVPFQANSGQVITIVVHTGGHVAPTERFAVKGVRAG
jgi:hypothetical protein